MTVEQDITNLQKQIDELKGSKDTPFTTAKTINPFSKLKKLEIEQGSTGSATKRKIPISLTGTLATDAHGSLANISHRELDDGQTDTVFIETIVLPNDYIPSTIITINWLHSNEGTSGNIRWIVFMQSYKEGATGGKALYNVTETIVVPTVANTMEIISKNLTAIPERNDFLGGFIRRTGLDGDDTNSSDSALWAVWFEYIAYN